MDKWLSTHAITKRSSSLSTYLSEEVNRPDFWNVINRHSFSSTPSNKVNFYTSGSLTASSMSLQSVNNTPSISSPFTVTPPSPSSPRFERVSDEEDRASIFSPGPTFVDDIADDMDDEKMMVYVI